MAIPSGNVTPLAQPAQDSEAGPVIRTIRLSDLHDALRLGWEDFKAVPSHAIILCIIYPVLGLMLVSVGTGGKTVKGSALLAPAVGGWLVTTWPPARALVPPR